MIQDLCLQDVLQLLLVQGAVSEIFSLLLFSGGLEEVLPHLRPSFEAADGRVLGACALLAMRLSARVLLCRQSLSSLQKLRSIAEKQLQLSGFQSFKISLRSLYIYFNINFLIAFAFISSTEAPCQQPWHKEAHLVGSLKWALQPRH